MGETNLGNEVFAHVNYTHSKLFSALLRFIGDRFGEDSVGEALDFAGREVWIGGYSDILSDNERLIEYWKKNYALGGFGYEVKEDAEKYQIVITDCKTGRRQIQEKACVGVGTGRHEWLFDKVGVPYYCGHCKVNKELLPNEINNRFIFECGLTVDEQGHVSENPCRLTILKKTQS